MSDFIPVILGLYMLANLIFFVVAMTGVAHREFVILDIRVKHLLFVLLLPAGAVAVVLIAIIFDIIDTLIYMAKKNKTFQRVMNKRVFPRKED